MVTDLIILGLILVLVIKSILYLRDSKCKSCPFNYRCKKDEYNKKE